MKPAPFAYRRPGDPRRRPRGAGRRTGAKVLAGGQSLVPLLSMRLAAPRRWSTSTRLPDLDHVTVTDDGVRVGALARHADVLARRGARGVPAAAGDGALARRPRDDPQPRYDGRLDRPRRRRGRDAGRARRCSAGRSTVASVRGHAAPSPPPTCSPARSSRRWPRRDRDRGVLPGAAAGEGVGFAEIARRHGDYALVRGRRPGPGRGRRGRRRRGSATSRSTTSPRSSTSRGASTRPPTRRRDHVLTDARPRATTSTRRGATAPSWCGCSPAAVAGARTPTDHAAAARSRHDRGASTTYGCRSTAPPTTSGCRPAGCSPTRCATTAA